MADNDSYTFDAEGNPIPAEKPPLAKKPPAAPRKSRSKKRASAQNAATLPDFEKSASENQEPQTSNGSAADIRMSSRRSSVAGTGGEDLLTDMFHIDGTGFDVTLSLRLQKVCWEAMNPSGRRRTRSGSLSGFFKRRKSSSGLKDSSQNSIDLCNIFGARLKRRHKAGQNEEEGFVLGLGLFTAEKKDPNTWREQEIYFEHPSVEICTRWSDKINAFLNSIQGRPKNVKLFLQPYAGDKNGRSIFKHKILPIFQNASVAVDVTIIQHNEHVKQEMIHLNIDDFDCVIAMGGDGTVSQVLNGLMNRSQKEQELELKAGSGRAPAPALIPLGIIPIGKTNQLAGSVMGAIDPVTAALHIVYGHWSPMDVCSVYSVDKFYRWAFNSQYGFAGNVLLFMKRYTTFGRKCIDAAFIKALTSSKLRAYECDIEFIPSTSIFAKEFNTVCRTGCERCQGQVAAKADGPEVTTDMVQELNLNNSLSSVESTGSVIELKQDSPWQTLKGSFMSVAVFSVPGNGEMAPEGLSKVTHLHDGHLDLVVVHSVDRKDFVRFLRRHGNSKNQYDFPYVEVHRCKEVRFRPRMPRSWNYSDHDFSEIKYQMSQQEMLKKKQQLYRSMEVIDDDLDSSQTKAIRQGLQGKSVSMFALDNSIDDNEEEEEDKEEEEDDIEEIEEIGDATEESGDGTEREKNSTKKKKAVGREESEAPNFRYVGPQYQPTWTEQEVARRRKIARKKEEKKKAKEEEKSKSVWSMDNEICTTLDLDFKVHSGLLMVSGLGISPHTEFDDIRFTCLPGR